MDHVVSTWSNVAYLLAAVGLWFLDPGGEALVVAAALSFLAVGSFQMHRTRDWGPWPAWEAVDHAGMHATYGAVAVHAWGAPWWLVLLVAVTAPVLLEISRNEDVVPAMAFYIVVTIVAGLVAGAFTELVLGLAIMGIGLFFWYLGDDVEHGIWHVLTALGTVFLYLVGA